MIMAIKENGYYMSEFMDSLLHFGNSIEELYSMCPNEALYISEALHGVASTARKYELALSESAAFTARRSASQALGRSITNLRYRLYECHEKSPEKTKGIYALLLDETLHFLWDPHIHHDIETYTKQQIVNAFETLLAPLSALDEYLGWIRKRVDDISDNITILEARMNENGKALDILKERSGRNLRYDDVQEETTGLFIPVIMRSTKHPKRRPTEHKRPVLTIVK